MQNKDKVQHSTCPGLGGTQFSTQSFEINDPEGQPEYNNNDVNLLL
jgi:hypothetical protein